MADDKLAIKNKAPMFGSMKKGIGANRENYAKKMAEVNPLEVPNRLGLVMDDSSSMGHTGMKSAHEAISGFLDACSPLDTSVAVYPLNAAPKPLECNYDLIKLFVNSIGPTGGTPIYGVLQTLITQVNMTRAILFSDGSPTDSSCLTDNDEESDSFWGRSSKLAKDVIKMYIEKEISIDTIYIGYGDSKELQKLAELTGGTYLHFENINTLRKNLKYLAPKYVALLANAELKAKVERGETI